MNQMTEWENKREQIEHSFFGVFDAMTLVLGLPKEFRVELIRNGFFLKPAAVKYHGNHMGGLFEHSYEVAMGMLRLNFQMPSLSSQSAIRIGLFHDICKTDDYVDEAYDGSNGIILEGIDTQISENPQWGYNPNKRPGHGSKSVDMLMQWTPLTEEEQLCIRFHMGAYETEAWKEYDEAIKKYPSVLWTHTADMYVSKVMGI